MAIFIKEQPIDLTIKKKDDYPGIRDALGRTGIKVRHRSLQSDNYSPAVSGWIIRANGTIEALSIIAGSYITSFVQTGIPTSQHIGDLWIKTDDNNKVYRAESVGADQITAGEWVEYGTLVNWSEIVGKPSNLFQIFYQSTAPASGMITGDYWKDSDDNKIYRYNGAAWVEVQDDDIASAISDAANAQSTADGKVYVYRQTTAPAGMAAGDVGDLWLDSDDGDKLYRYSGSAWEEVQDDEIAQAISDAATAQATADGKIVTFYQDGIPTATDIGDLWVDTNDGNKLYRAESVGADEIKDGEWVEIQDDDIATAIADAATAQSTADSKIITFYQDAVPTATDAGDLWVDTNDKNKLYRATAAGDDEITAGEWELVRDTDIAQAITDAANAQSTADGKIVTFYQAAAPTAEGTGDLWVDTDDTNKLYRWSGAAWVTVVDTDIQQALSDAAGAQSTADGKIVSFFQTSAPTAEGTGDIWFDTDDDNKPYRWNGSSWEVAEFDVATWTKIIGLDNSTPAIAEIRFNTLFRRYCFMGYYNDGLTEAAGGGTISRFLILTRLDSGGNDCTLSSIRGHVLSGNSRFTPDNADFECVCMVQLEAVVNQDAFWGISDDGNVTLPNNSVLVVAHSGFVVEDGVLYASTGDGDSQAKTEITGITLTNMNIYRIHHDLSEGEVYFYVNDVLKATHSTDLMGNGHDPSFLFGIKAIVGTKHLDVCNNYLLIHE